MDFRYKITIRGWDNEAGEYTDATEQVWWRTNKKFSMRELLKEHGKEMPLFDCSSEDLEVSIYEVHSNYTKLLEQAWAGEVYASFGEVW